LLERDGYPPGVPCWIDTAQPDPEAAASFYGDLFGWTFTDRMPADMPGSYFMAQLEGRDVAAVGSQQGGPSAPVWSTYISVDSVDEAIAQVTATGGSVLVEPFNVLDAGRMAVLMDPSGAVFSVWQALEHKGAQLVNHPGTWNWSDLNTRDPKGAEDFYGAVFGWKVNRGSFDGIGDYAMLCVPGYGAFLEARDPDIYQRQADAGAPEGFADAIAWMMPMTPDQYPDDVPSHWSVTFAVDDTDAIAAGTADLGGEVVVPPFDVGGARAAVLSDPQGAVFSVSKYDPG
jgi:uncharacterized protein